MLVVAAELQEDRVQAEPADGLEDLAARPSVAPAAEEAAQDSEAGLRGIRLRGLVRSVTQRDVRDLVGEDARELALVSSGLEEPAVDVEEATGKREGVDLLESTARTL